MLKKWKLLAAVLVITLMAAFAFSACNNINEIIDFDSLRSLDGVEMTMEQTKYETGDTEITVTWINNTEESLIFGESYYLVKKVNSRWETVPALPDTAFISIGYNIEPYSQASHTYELSHVYKVSNLKSGTYRIVTHFFSNADIPVTGKEAYWLYAEFEFANSDWKDIAENVVEKTTKSDANFKIAFDSQEIIVDGDKVFANASVFYYTDYMSKEGDDVYYYRLYEDVWYKAKSVSISEPATLATYVVRETVLSIVNITLNDLANVKYEGNGKYSYMYAAAGHIAIVGHDPVINYEFYTDGNVITKILLHGVTYNIIYGGQSVTLPDAVEPTPLPAPQNLKITDGVLTWDEVTGAKDYYVEIFSGSNYYRGAATVSSAEYDLGKRFVSQPDIFGAGKYTIIVRANFGVFTFLTNSDISRIAYNYSK